MSNTVVWSKDHCPYCDMAKNLLKTRNIEFEDRNISRGEWTKEQLLEAVPGARTVPQIFIDGKLVGTYEHLKEHFNQIDNKS